MYVLLENREDILNAQSKLEKTIRRSLTKKVEKTIGYPGGNIKSKDVYTNDEYWYWSEDHAGSKRPNPRRLNWFGVFNKDAHLHITVEINTAFEGRNDQIAGFFARNSQTGITYLFHSGKVGGGTKNVGKNEFLTWHNEMPVEIYNSQGRYKEGLLVMPVEGRDAVRPGLHYIDNVAHFKKLARTGELSTKDFQSKVELFKQYYEESHGRRTGKRTSEIDYISRHGEVVNALFEWRKSRPRPKARELKKDVFIDLGVTVNGDLTELYEVKTTTKRNDIYTAIGQLMVHGSNEPCRRIMVLPAEPEINPQLEKTVRLLGVEILKYSLTENSVKII